MKPNPEDTPAEKAAIEHLQSELREEELANKELRGQISKLEKENLRLSQLAADLHKGVCSGYTDILGQLRRLKSQLIEGSIFTVEEGEIVLLGSSVQSLHEALDTVHT